MPRIAADSLEQSVNFIARPFKKLGKIQLCEH